MSTIIIISPPPKDPPARSADPDGFAQSVGELSPYAEALDAIAEAQAAGCRVRIIGD